MRLIDADNLEKELLELCGDNPPMFHYFSEAIKVIREQPTAYDLNKVVEYLEKAANKFDTPNDGDVWIRNGIFLAKQIVKGAVKDE